MISRLWQHFVLYPAKHNDDLQRQFSCIDRLPYLYLVKRALQRKQMLGTGKHDSFSRFTQRKKAIPSFFTCLTDFQFTRLHFFESIDDDTLGSEIVHLGNGANGRKKCINGPSCDVSFNALIWIGIRLGYMSAFVTKAYGKFNQGGWVVQKHSP